LNDKGSQEKIGENRLTGPGEDQKYDVKEAHKVVKLQNISMSWTKNKQEDII
jgi:hypothetical protein